jgi:4'-phosphopantetheinyl transferase
MAQVRLATDSRVPLPGAVHLWTIDLNQPACVVSSLLNVLDASERARALRLWEGPLRSRFVVTHGATREILAQYLGIPAGILQLERPVSGKPRVRGAALSFNISHSGNIAVCAVSYGGRLGVDLEQVRPIASADAMVARFFAPAEAQQYAAMPADDRQAAWFACWTRKEAFLKATGELLERTVDSFEVDLTPAATAPSVTAAGETGWWMRSFSPAAGYVAAVAGDFPIAMLNSYDWTPADAESALCRPVEERNQRFGIDEWRATG